MPYWLQWTDQFGIFVWMFTFLGAILTGFGVVTCIERGCCMDNAATEANCVATGYP